MASNLDEIGALFVGKIQSEFDSKGLSDTGKAKSSISYRAGKEKLVIEGLARVLFLQYGRRSGKMPNVEAIRGWVERKLNVPQEEIEGVAFAIAKKIQKKGTNILTDRAKGLQLELIISEMMDKITEIVSTFEAKQVSDDIFSVWTKSGYK